MGDNKDYMTHPDELGCLQSSEVVLEKIQTAVSNAIESMTGFSVKAVNVHVGGVSFQS